MHKKIIVRIAEGLGNQLFMYANSLALSKKFNYELNIDNTSGYFKKKNQNRSYILDKFNISANLSDKNLRFDNYYLDIKRKYLKKTDFLRKNKRFIIEKVDNNKKTFFSDHSSGFFSNNIFVEGHFESEKYFDNYKNIIKKEFIIKDQFLDTNNYSKMLSNTNSVSIALRRNRFSEGYKKDNIKSEKFFLNTIDYINKSVELVKTKIPNPKFFIWSNDFTDMENYYDPSEFIFIKNEKNKILNDFDLFKYSKHFIVGPTSFHWWGAWLNSNKDSLCIRPLNLNVSNNKDLWPEAWLPV